MSAPRVNYKEKDLSAYVQSGDSLYVAIVLAATRGPVEKPTLGIGRKQFLQNFTPRSKVEVGYPTAYFSALTVLESTGNLVVVRAASPDAKFAGLHIKQDGTTAPLTGGTTNPSGVDISADSFFLTSADQGLWGSDYRATVLSYKYDEVFNAVAVDGTIATSQTWGKGYPVRFVGSKLPAELSADKTYFVVQSAAGKLQLSATKAGAVATSPVTISLAQDATVNCRIVPAISYTKIPNTMLIQIFHKDDLNNPVKEYIVSKTQGAKDADGYPLYIEDVIKGSPYIRAIDNVLNSQPMITDITVPTALSGGSDGSPVTDADMVRALGTLANSNEFNIKVLMDGGRSTVAYHNALISLAETRKDCVPVLSSPLSSQTGTFPAQSIVNFRKYEANFNTSFGALYAPHVKVLDEFNSREVWVAPDGVVTKAIIDTASNFEIWYPVGGDTRGVVNVLDTYIHFSDPEQDLLYDAGVNPIVYEAGQGIKIWGQKTLLSTPSMLDRLNVRLLLITIGPAIKRFLKSYLFEFNDAPTRASLLAKVNAYMDGVLARKGVVRYLAICDLTNNTQEDLDNHRLVLDLLICPNNSVEDIPFTIGVVNNSVSFDLAQQQL